MNCPLCQKECLPPDQNERTIKEKVLKCGDGKTHFFYYHPNVSTYIVLYKKSSRIIPSTIVSLEQRHAYLQDDHMTWYVKLHGGRIIASEKNTLSPIEAAHLLIKFKKLILFS